MVASAKAALGQIAHVRIVFVLSFSAKNFSLAAVRVVSSRIATLNIQYLVAHLLGIVVRY